MAGYFDESGFFVREAQKMECEYTAPDSGIEAMDCQRVAVIRIDDESVTPARVLGVFCEEHAPTPIGAQVAEEIIYPGSTIVDVE